MNQLFKETVHQDGEGGKADVVKGEIHTVIQRLWNTQVSVNCTMLVNNILGYCVDRHFHKVFKEVWKDFLLKK